jgi:hypothetical protein
VGVAARLASYDPGRASSNHFLIRSRTVHSHAQRWPRQRQWGHDPFMDDAVDRYMTHSTSNDIDGLVATLAPDAELISPISGNMVFRGREDLRVVLTAIYGTCTGLRWHDKVSDSNACVIMGKARIGPLAFADALVLELDDDGRIERIKPHLRPWLATTLLAFRLASKIGRHPEVVRRAMRHGRLARAS